MAEKKYTQEQLLAMFGNVVNSYETQTGKPFGAEAAEGLADVIAKHEKGLPIGETKPKEDVLYSTKEKSKFIKREFDALNNTPLTDFYKTVVTTIFENLEKLNEAETITAAGIVLDNLYVAAIKSKRPNNIAYSSGKETLKKINNVCGRDSLSDEEKLKVKNMIEGILKTYDKKDVPLGGVKESLAPVSTMSAYNSRIINTIGGLPKDIMPLLNMAHIVKGGYDPKIKEPKTKENIFAAKILADIFCYMTEDKNLGKIISILDTSDY